MAGIVVSVSMGVMKPILDKLAVLMGDEYKKLKGLRKKVSFLERELRAMNALLEKMDASDELDPQAKDWRKDIIELSYDIEDYIDDFMDHVGEAREKVGVLKKACHYVRTFNVRRGLGDQFEEMKTRVVEASERKMRCKFDECISSTTAVVVDPHLSALYNESACLVGIDDQKQELVNWVLDEGQQLKVISIVGFGGLGKTTLANEVCREVGTQFNCKAFVSVSSKPDMIRLLNSILSQLEQQDRKTSQISEMDLIIKNIRMCLQDKRYFIVIDDLWDIQAWNIIRCTFLQNNRHSRVVITTRNAEVARLCSSNHRYIHTMKPLSEQDSRKLFLNRIFGSDDNYSSPFEELSCAILKKCSGLPLAIVTIASILACQPTRLKDQWESIQNSLSSISATKSLWEDMMNILELSYRSLPNSLKPCFLYLGTYPEDYKISKDELIRRWVAERFVMSDPQGQDVWHVAESYFNELANRSMIQPAYEYDNKFRVTHCRVHDMMLELIVRKCKEDNFLSYYVNDLQMMAQGQDKVRRLTIDLNSVKDVTTEMTITEHLSRVRSLSVFQGSNWIPMLLELKYVRVLFLRFNYRNGRTGKDFVDLTAINQLSQLRYLKVENVTGYIYKLHLRSLQHLETLELTYVPLKCGYLSDLVDLPRLSHVVIQGYAVLPEGIGKVKSLRTFNGIFLPASSLKNIEALGQLTGLTNISIDSHTYVAEPTQGWFAAWSSSLEKLVNLKRLSVFLDNLATCADALSSSWVSTPFPNLEVLDLAVWIFTRVPRWIGGLHNLRELRLSVKNIDEEDVGVIGGLPWLVLLYLRIQELPAARTMVIGASTGFRLLEWFDLDCDGMSCLTFESGAMPSLFKLRMFLNPRAWDKGTPVGLEHLSSLKEIHVLMKENDEGLLVRDTFQKAFGTLPGRPKVFVSETFFVKVIKEIDLLLSKGHQRDHEEED